MFLLAACGGSDSGVSRLAGTRLQARVEAIRTAASHAGRSATERRVMELLVVVDELQAKGELSAAAQARIRHAAAAVSAQLSLLPAPTTTTTTAPPPEEHKGKGHGKGNEGNDHGKD